ncbi:unnamed protein product [Leptidea sinapis]|uniref:Mannosyltransferase n=1 Tax=Leptidea sinapis TaxID=189913 RepID=A0A5E4R2B7_9NEOP|nr:unnamed protein product [Leptidea sinapis]
MALASGLRPLQVFILLLSARILSVFLVQTWYVPDEYWQTLEVAHKHVFGYGELTWEWQKGIRSYLYPSVVSAIYYALKLTSLDYPTIVVLAPRIFQAILSAFADFSFYKWSGNRKWALFVILTSWFWFYTASRTLLQTTETALVAIALSMFPFKAGKPSYYEKGKEKSLLIVIKFVLPLLPMLMYLAQDVIVPWSRKAKKWQLYTLAGLLVVGNVAPAFYFGTVHQSGPLRVMPLLREEIKDNKTSVLFLMPCHSTPLYSYQKVK